MNGKSVCVGNFLLIDFFLRLHLQIIFFFCASKFYFLKNISCNIHHTLALWLMAYGLWFLFSYFPWLVVCVWRLKFKFANALFAAPGKKAKSNMLKKSLIFFFLLPPHSFSSINCSWSSSHTSTPQLLSHLTDFNMQFMSEQVSECKYGYGNQVRWEKETDDVYQMKFCICWYMNVTDW